MGPWQIHCHSAQVRSKIAYTRPSWAQNFTCAHHRSRCHSAHVRSKTICTRPSWVPSLTCAHHRSSKTHKPLEVSWFLKFQKIFTQDLCFGTFFLPKWDFWLWGIKIILMVPRAILAMFQKLVPRFGPKIEIVLTLVSVLGPKVPWWTLQTTHIWA